MISKQYLFTGKKFTFSCEIFDANCCAQGRHDRSVVTKNAMVIQQFSVHSHSTTYCELSASCIEDCAVQDVVVASLCQLFYSHFPTLYRMSCITEY